LSTVHGEVKRLTDAGFCGGARWDARRWYGPIRTTA
jgi:hypothetical protein